jgi:hypothetical protein
MTKHNHYKFLSDKWTKKHQELTKNVAKKHKNSFEWLSNNSKQLAVGSLGSLLLLTSPTGDLNVRNTQIASAQTQTIDSKTFLITDLKGLVPEDVRPLNNEEESKIGELLSNKFGMKVSAAINDMRLNRSYGLIGAEQHLSRYPGDTMATHFDGNSEDSNKYYSSGMAPGLGAWGYFATSKTSLTQEDTMREKYYLATQTFLVPDYNERVGEYRDFFKFRKMLVVNPENGKAVIAVIGDAGPAQWTGKHLGGSPEVMKYLERVDGSARGPVLYFFVDDPDDEIPLGPVEPLNS